MKTTDPGCACCAPAKTLTFNVKGCNSTNFPGVDVTFAGETKTTDAAGQAVFARPGAGTYSYTLSSTADARWSNASGGSFTLTSFHDGLTNVNVGHQYTAASGYVCVPCCILPFAKTLYMADPALGTVTLTWNTGSSWIATVNFSATSYNGAGTYTGTAPGGCVCSGTSGTRTVQVQYGFSACTTSDPTIAGLSMAWAECRTGDALTSVYTFRDNTPAGCFSNGGNGGTTLITHDLPPALYYEFHLSLSTVGIGSAGGAFWGGAPTFILTE